MKSLAAKSWRHTVDIARSPPSSTAPGDDASAAPPCADPTALPSALALLQQEANGEPVLEHSILGACAAAHMARGYEFGEERMETRASFHSAVEVACHAFEQLQLRDGRTTPDEATDGGHNSQDDKPRAGMSDGVCQGSAASC